jgi:hypothetical protein
VKRIRSLLGVLVVLSAIGAGVALAASSPTVATVKPTKVTNTSADLHATVNPNGNSTGYQFQYGLSTAYGLATSSHSAGGGTKKVNVTTAVKGLTPGTRYHFRIVALNRSGGAYGRDISFKTTGAPPAAVITGPPSTVRKTLAALTGAINPEGAPTTWVLQYGRTGGYGVETFAQKLPAVKSAVPVSAVLSGLAPATLFHYRFVAYHGTTVVSAGQDATFFTEPDRRPKSHVAARTTPRVFKRSPYRFTTNGTIRAASFIPASSRCQGKVTLTYRQGKKRVGVVAAPLGSNCRFTAQETFHRRRGRGAIPLRISIRFGGNGYLMPSTATNRVTAG